MTTPDYSAPAATLGTGTMPLLGFGTWLIENSDASTAVQVALGAGYRHIDTATGYHNEDGIGAGLAAAGLQRESVFVTTKLPPDHAGRERQTLDESLAKLKLDRVDLWLVHWPPNKKASPAVWEQLIKAQQDGLATSIGVSNYSLDQ
ncbi:MAG: aldo/keto reductase, partial [Nakamurella sp.]